MTELLIATVFALLLLLAAVLFVIWFIQLLDDDDLFKTANNELERRKRLRAGPLPTVDERHLSVNPKEQSWKSK